MIVKSFFTHLFVAKLTSDAPHPQLNDTYNIMMVHMFPLPASPTHLQCSDSNSISALNYIVMSRASFTLILSVYMFCYTAVMELRKECIVINLRL